MADDWNKRIEFQFSAPVEIPGNVLTPGKYVFQLADSQWDRSIVEVFSQDSNGKESLVTTIFSALAFSHLEPSRLEVEITESVLLRDFSSTRAALCQLRAMGVGISLDDFGVGHGGLSCLNAVPLDKIKIDRSFSQDLFNDSRALKLLRGIAKLSSDLGIIVAVKGIETQEQADLIAADSDIDEVQGFLFSSAVSARRIKELLAPYQGATSLGSTARRLTIN